MSLLAMLVTSLMLASRAAAADETPRFEPTECWFATSKDGVDCGYLVVPENRRKDDSRMIRVATAIVRASDGERAPDPVVFIGGGPGYPIGLTEDGLERWRQIIDRTPALQRRDVILFEQRGVGRSIPDLNCPEFDPLSVDPALVLADNQAIAAAYREAAIACRDRLLRDGTDFAGYSGVDFAADTADLRRALRLDAWNLVGVSYGTRVVLTLLRDHPEGVRAAVLSSVYPLEAQSHERFWTTARNTLAHVFEDCASSAFCRATNPRPADLLRTSVRRLNDSPMIVEIAHPLDGSQLAYPVTGSMSLEFLLDVLAFDQANTALTYIQMLASDPVAAARATAGYLVAKYAGSPGLSEAVHYATECREEYPFNDPMRIAEDLRAYTALAGKEGFDEFHLICSVWQMPAAPPVENEPVTSAIATLLLTGEFDHLTPPEDAWATHTRLPSSFLFEFYRVGHDVLWGKPCALVLLSEFLEHPERKPSDPCGVGEARSFPE